MKKKIDCIDNEILYLLNERILIVKEIGLIKQENKLSLYNKERENNILKNKIINNKYNLSDDFIFNLYKLLFFESYINEKLLINKKYLNKNITIIGGSGSMGKLFLNLFKNNGFKNLYSINSKN
ncbi:chorismate mutase [Candidatus Nardonella dryophthoridicola]|uniref:chorismate mutase n=1 Tax=Candidatus Nardonella dryophthoridicola TaxID=1971485 RepID=UPI003B976F21